MRVLLYRYSKQDKDFVKEQIAALNVDEIEIEILDERIDLSFKAELQHGIIPYYRVRIVKAPRRIAFRAILDEIRKHYEELKKQLVVK